MQTLKELKLAIKTATRVFVWCNWMIEDGDYVETTKPKLLRAIGADTRNDGAHGGRTDTTPCRFRVEDGDLYLD